jgi:hypothetical protein
MRELPTLGGNNGYAAGGNNSRRDKRLGRDGGVRSFLRGGRARLERSGVAILPVVYGPGVDAIRALPLIAGDSSGAATAINDAARPSASRAVATRRSGVHRAAHAVLWDRGGVTDIGQGVLTAPFWNTPTAISSRGDVVRFSPAIHPTPDGEHYARVHLDAKDGGMQLLNTAPDDNSTATGHQREAAGGRLFRRRGAAPAWLRLGSAITACAI